ncbi:hypothetical protein I4U23_020342 [Adineta vaga]|nr:hypothetical protein I4U23_020342 [Adineta vaga]
MIMTDRTHSQSIRPNHVILQSIELKRRQSVPNIPSLISIHVIKLPRQSYHQSLKIQDTHPSEKCNVKSGNNNNIRKDLSSAINKNPIGQNRSNPTNILQPSETSLFNRPTSLQVKQNTHIHTDPHSAHINHGINNREIEHHHKLTTITKIYPTPNHRKISFDNSTIIDHCKDITLIEKPSKGIEFTNKYNQKYRNRKRGWFNTCCKCSPWWILLSLIVLIVLGGVIAAIILTLLSKGKTTTITITTTITTTSTSTTTSITTTTSTVTSSSTSTTSATTTSVTTVTQTTTTTDIPCSPTCNSEQSCIEGICINVGHLACTLTWSRAGDGDIVVATPNGKTISYKNKGSSSNTDYGELDRDDQVNKGPENVYWKTSGPLPPTGTYYICFEPYKFISPVISVSDPLTITYRIVRPSGFVLIFTRTFTSTIKNSYNCDANSGTLIGSFTYP